MLFYLAVKWGRKPHAAPYFKQASLSTRCGQSSGGAGFGWLALWRAGRLYPPTLNRTDATASVVNGVSHPCSARLELFCFPLCGSQHSAWPVDCDKSGAPRLFVQQTSQAYKAKVTLKPAAQPDQMAAVSLINKGVYRWHLAYAPEKNLLSIQKQRNAGVPESRCEQRRNEASRQAGTWLFYNTKAHN